MALQNLRSSTPSKRPDASSMSDGQIAINTAAASAGLFFKDSNGDLVKTGPVHIGTTAPNSTPATGGSTGNSKGEAWLDTSNNNYVLKIYDGTAFRSVEIAPGSARQLLQTNAAGTDVEFTSNVDVPGTLDVTSTAVFDANVGIGVSNPARPLHVSSSLNNPVRIQSSATYSRIEFEANGTTSPANVSIGAENNDFRIFTGSGTGRLIVKDDGKTGIGITAPLGQLHVRPANECNFVVREESTALVLSAETNSGRDNNRIMALEGGTFTFSVSGNERARIASNGDVGIGTSSPANKLTVVDTSSTGIRSQSASTQATDANKALHVSNGNTTDTFNVSYKGQGYFAGNVGIGTGSPNMLLDAQGNNNPQLRVSATNTGTNSAGLHIENQGQRNWQIYADRSSDQLRISHNSRASTVVSVTDTRVGIGTSSPGQKLVVSEGGAQGLEFNPFTSDRFILAGYNRSTSQYIQLEYEGSNHIFKSGTSEKLRLTSGGNVGIGTTSPIAKLTCLGINSGGEGGNLCIQNTGSGLNTNVALYLTPNNGGGNDLQRTAAIKSRQDVAGNFANLEFYTSTSNTPTERMRITSSGHVLIHQTSSSTPGFNNTTTGTSFEKVEGTALFISRENQATLFCNRNGDGNLMRFFRSGSQVGRVDVSSTNATFVTTSDYRLKENVTSLSDGIDRLKLLTPRRFNFIAAPGETIDGFIAHELSDAVPEAVFGEKDAMEEQEVEVTPAVLDDEGNVTTEAVTEKKSVISPQGIDQGKLMPLLTAALQEAVAKIETLETKVAALEAE